MCTMDYVDAVLFRNRWEAVENIEGYMMGSAGSPVSQETFPRRRQSKSRVQTSEAACQTPCEWLQSSPSKEVKELEPRRAPELKRSLDTGTKPPGPKTRPKIVQCNPIADRLMCSCHVRS